MTWSRHLVCTEREFSQGRGPCLSLQVLPFEADWSSCENSFDLLGLTVVRDIFRRCPWAEGRLTQHDCDSPSFASTTRGCSANGWLRLDSPCLHCDMWNACDAHIRVKVMQLLETTWRVFDFLPQTIEQGMEWLGSETVRQLLVVAHMFAALEKQEGEHLSVDVLWKHSIRTGCLAGFLAKGECGDSDVISRSCVAGYSHDIGLAVLALSLTSSHYTRIMSRARRESLSLATAELRELGLSHDSIGAAYLRRHMFPQSIVDAVAFHDDPQGLESPGVTPTLAVFAANTLDGGGWPQDSDGTPSERAMEYLAVHGYVDPWPTWHRYAVKVQSLELGYA